MTQRGIEAKPVQETETIRLLEKLSKERAEEDADLGQAEINSVIFRLQQRASQYDKAALDILTAVSHHTDPELRADIPLGMDDVYPAYPEEVTAILVKLLQDDNLDVSYEAREAVGIMLTGTTPSGSVGDMIPLYYEDAQQLVAAFQEVPQQ